MNRSYIDMHLAVDRYLRGTLSDEETAEFEERLVWDQALLDDVQLAERLRRALQSDLNLNEAANSDQDGFMDRARSLLRTPAYAAAASFLLAVGGMSIVLTSTGPGGAPSGIDGGLPTEIVPLYATRSSDAVPVTVADDAWTVLLVDAPFGYSGFRAAVFRQGDDSSAVWSRDGLAPTYPDSLAVGMPGALLPAGAYVLRLDGMAEGASGYERIQEISFDVSRGGAAN